MMQIPNQNVKNCSSYRVTSKVQRIQGSFQNRRTRVVCTVLIHWSANGKSTKCEELFEYLHCEPHFYKALLRSCLFPLICSCQHSDRTLFFK